MPNIGVPELLIVLVIALVIFGPKKLPQLGRQLGAGMREFKDSVTGSHKDDDDDEPDVLEESSDEPASKPKAAARQDSAPAARQDSA